MSVNGIRLMSSWERDSLTAELTRNAQESLKLFRTEQRLLSAFRCACKVGNMNLLHIRDFIALCEQCRWCANKEEDMDEEEELDHASGDCAQLYTPDSDTIIDAAARAEQDRLANQFRRNAALQRAGQSSTFAALWREPKKALASVGDSARFDAKNSIGTGIQRRHIRNTVAVHNVLHALATRESITAELTVLSKHAVREAFSFCVADGRDECSLLEFTKLLLLLARHFLRDIEDEFGHVYALDKMWDRSISNFVREYTVASLDEVAQRLPIATFPGMPMVQAMYGDLCSAMYALVGGGSPAAQRDILRFVNECDVCVLHEHVSSADVLRAFTFAHSHAVAVPPPSMDPAADSPQEGDEPALNAKSFLDFLAILGVYAFSVEAKHALFPTLASKCEHMILFLKDWYERRTGHDFLSAVRPPPRDPPQIVSMEPMQIVPTGKERVVVVGKQFPTGGVYLKFGNWIAITSPKDPVTGENTVLPPPVDLDRLEVLFQSDTDDGTREFCVVRRFREVRVSVSVDGASFYPFIGHTFVFEQLEAPFPVGTFLPRLARVFVHYASDSNRRAFVEAYLDLASWIQFCRDYRFLPKTAVDAEAEVQTEAYQLVVKYFHQYSQEVRDTTKKAVEGVKPKLVRVLSSHNFSRCVLTCVVASGTPLRQGINDLLGSDQWVGRDSLPDVPEAQLGAHALQIRRAAKGTALSRRGEGVGEKHYNSPRGGRLALIESDVLSGADADGVTDLTAYQKGMWTNESEHSKMIFRFLTTADRDQIDDPQARQAALSSLNYGKVVVKGIETTEPNGEESVQPKLRDAVAEARDRTKIAVAQAIVQNQRAALNSTARRALDAEERRKRQIQRLQADLDDAQAKAAALEKQVSSVAKLTSSDAPMLHHGSAGVLQAEKEALHRVFVYELEKRKAQLVAKSVQDENMRDVERNRVMKEMKDRLVDSDVSFSRLQDVVIGQSETIERQADVLRLLKDRATILTADVMYYRSAHSKLLEMVGADPGRADIVTATNEEMASHEVNVESVLAELRMEAKGENAKKKDAGNGIKELVKLQKAKAKTRGTEADPLSESDFVLPAAPKMKVSLSAEEAEERAREAAREVEHVKDAQIRALLEQVDELRARLPLDDDLPRDNGVDEDDEFSDDETVLPDGSRSGRSSRSHSRHSSRGKKRDGLAVFDTEVQTEPVTVGAREPTPAMEDPLDVYFGHPAEVKLHAISPLDTFASIAAQFHVPVEVLYRANFVTPPHPRRFSSRAEMDEEMKLILMGIAGRVLKVPTLVDGTALRERGALRLSISARSTPRSEEGGGGSSRSRSPSAHTLAAPNAAFESLPVTPRGGNGGVTPVSSQTNAQRNSSKFFHGKPPTPARQVTSSSSVRSAVVGWETDATAEGAATTTTPRVDDVPDNSSRWSSSATPAVGAAQTPIRSDLTLPGLDSLIDASGATPKQDPLLDIPNTIPLRSTVSVTPSTSSKRVDKVARRTEAQLGHATAALESAIAAVSSQVAGGSGHVDEQEKTPSEREVTLAPPSQGDTAPSRDEMTQYVDLACAEAQAMKQTFLFDAPSVAPRSRRGSSWGESVIKSRKSVAATSLSAVTQTTRARSQSTRSVGGEHPTRRRSTSPSRDSHDFVPMSVQELSDPEWLMVVASPVQAAVERTLSISLQEDASLMALVAQERLFVKQLHHFGEAELLRRLLIVREAQEFFQSCVKRFSVMRSQTDRDWIFHQLQESQFRSESPVDVRIATQERERMHMQVQNAAEECRRLELAGARRLAGRDAANERKALLAESRTQQAAANAAEKRQLRELATLRRDLSQGGRSTRPLVVAPRPRFLQPIDPAAAMTSLKLLDANSTERGPPSSPPPIQPAASPEAVQMLSALLQSPVKLSPLIQPPAVPPPNLPSSATEHIELVAKAEALLLAKRQLSKPT